MNYIRKVKWPVALYDIRCHIYSVWNMFETRNRAAKYCAMNRVKFLMFNDAKIL